MRTAYFCLLFLPAVLLSQPEGWDADQDAMPNDWELFHQLDANDPKNAWQDPDKDGVCNLYEYFLGANPRDPRDPVKLNYDGTTPLAEIIDGTPRRAVLRLPEGTYPLNYSFQSLDNAPRLLIQGGWNADFTERDYCQYSTVLDGGRQGAIFNYLVAEGNSTALILDGLTLTNAGREAVAYRGYLSKVQLLLAHCSIRDNRPHRTSATVRFEDSPGTLISDFILLNTSITDNLGTALQVVIHGNITNVKILHSILAYNDPSENDDPPYQSGHGVKMDSDAPEPVAVQFANSVFWENQEADLYVEEEALGRLQVRSRHNVYGFIQPASAGDLITHPSDRSSDPGLAPATNGRYYPADNSPLRDYGLHLGITEDTEPDAGLLPCPANQTTTGITALDISQSVALWPNPNAGEILRLRFESAPAEVEQIQVFNSLGRQVALIRPAADDISRGSYQIRVDGWAPGYYRLVFTGANVWGTRGFVRR